jgi:hypothetical protein
MVQKGTKFEKIKSKHGTEQWLKSPPTRRRFEAPGVGAHESPRAASPTIISPTLRNLTKAEILATGFFPPPNAADLTDLEGATPPQWKSHKKLLVNRSLGSSKASY